MFPTTELQGNCPSQKSPSTDDEWPATSDLHLMISVEKRPYLGSNLVPTLANLQVHNFTHFVWLGRVGGYNLSQALQLCRTSPVPAALSATPSTALPQGPFYTPGTVTQPARGVASPRHCSRSPGPFTAWVQVQQHRCITCGLESSIVTCIPSQFPVQQCGAWMNICAYSVCVSLFYIRHNIYTNICAYREIIAQSEWYLNLLNTCASAT